MNRVLLTGRLTRDPELRTTAGGKAVAQFSVASHEYVSGKEKSEFHNVVAWDRLAETCGRYLGKGQQVAIEGRLQTRSWDDDKGSPPLEDRDRREQRRDAVRAAEEGLRRGDGGLGPRGQALAAGIAPDASEPVADDAGFSLTGGDEEDDEEDEILEEAVAAA